MTAREDQIAHAAASRKMPTLGAHGQRLDGGVLAKISDSFKNFVTGMGVRGRDRVTANQVAMVYILTFPELAELYVGDGLGKRVVDMPSDDATRAGWDIEGDPDGKLNDEMGRLNVQKHFNEGLRWQRLFGGALTVCIWDDGQPLYRPFKFNPQRPQKLVSMRTHSASEIWIMPTDLDTDPLSPRYDLPTMFTIRRMYGPPYAVHWTRVFEWRGSPVPDRTMYGMDLYRRYWGFGVIQAAFQAMSSMGLTWNAVSNLLQEAVIGKYTLTNLAQLLMENDYAGIEQRMMNLEQSKNILKGVLLGEGESYSRDALTFAGLADVIDRMMQNMSSEVGIPVSLLYGRGPAGMNATGEGDARQYYDSVAAMQDKELRSPLQTLAVWLGASALPKVDPDEFNVRFRPVWSMSEKEMAETKYKMAQADSLYKVNGILSPKEIRRVRFVGGYSYETSLLSNETEPPPDPAMLGEPAGAAQEHAGASAVPELQQENTLEQTKQRSTKYPEHATGAAEPGQTTVHTPSPGNRTAQ